MCSSDLNTTLRVKNKTGRSVVHGVAGRCFTFGLFVIHLEVFGGLGQLLGIGDQGDIGGIEGLHIGTQHIGRIALGVERDKYALDSISQRAL